MKQLTRNPVIRFVICLVLCVALVSLNVVYPLTVPVHAVVIETIAIGVIQTLLLSLGWGLALDYDGTTEDVNQAFADILTWIRRDTGANQSFDEVTAKLEAAWNEKNQDVVIANIRYSDWEKIAKVVAQWAAEHAVQIDEHTYQLQVATTGGEVYLEFKNAYHGQLDQAIKYAQAYTEPLLRTVCGKALIYYGNKTGVFIDRSGNYNALVNCADFQTPGNGTHCRWATAYSNGSVDKPKRCYSCTDGYPPEFGFLAFDDGYGRTIYSGSCYVFGTICPELPVAERSDARIGYPINFSKPVIGVGGSISVPVEKDDRFAPGVVTGAWQDLIGRVGDIASSLPISFPMTPAGIQDIADAGAVGVLPEVLTKEIVGEVDVPAEGDVDLPDVGDLKLPATIATKFPFCIPFDAVKGLSLLSATPVAPNFKIPFKFGNTIDYSIDISFDRFSGVIAMIRWFERALFIAILMVNTRKFIKW